LEKTVGQQLGAEPKPQLVERINAYLRSGDYSRALGLLPTMPSLPRSKSGRTRA
jgi:hypothetical protein